VAGNTGETHGNGNVPILQIALQPDHDYLDEDCQGKESGEEEDRDQVIPLRKVLPTRAQ